VLLNKFIIYLAVCINRPIVIHKPPELSLNSINQLIFYC